MKRLFPLALLAACITTACGGSEANGTPNDWQGQRTDSVLSATDPLVGTWCATGWPGCVSIQSSGDGFLANNGDGCWWQDDQQYSGLTPSGTPKVYTGTRYQYGSGICPPISPQSVTITLSSTNSAFTEVTSTGFTHTWTRSP
jgi:hypothetical protein